MNPVSEQARSLKSCQHLCWNTKVQSVLTLLATVDELSSVDALCSDEQLRPLLEAVRITESHFGQGSAATGVVDNVLWIGPERNVCSDMTAVPRHLTSEGPCVHLHDALDVTVAFGEVDVTEFGGAFSVLDVGFEDGARTFPLSPDHTSHRVLEDTASEQRQTQRYRQWDFNADAVTTFTQPLDHGCCTATGFRQENWQYENLR